MEDIINDQAWNSPTPSLTNDEVNLYDIYIDDEVNKSFKEKNQKINFFVPSNRWREECEKSTSVSWGKSTKYLEYTNKQRV